MEDDKRLADILAKLADWDGFAQEPYEDWMGRLDHPVHPEELLDLGMADLLPLMNIKDKTWTGGSCMHQPQVVLWVLDDEWFETVALPIILKHNEDDCLVTLEKVHSGRHYSSDLLGRGINAYWDVVPAGSNFFYWYNAKKKALEWYKAVYLAFEEIRNITESTA